MTLSTLAVGAAALALVSALLGWRRPVAGLGLWAALLPVQLDTVASLGLRFALSDAVLAGLLVAEAARALRRPAALVPDAFIAIGGSLLLWLALTSTFAVVARPPEYVRYNKLLGLASLLLAYWLVVRGGAAPRAPEVLRWFAQSASAWNLLGLGAWVLWTGFGVLTRLVYHPVGEDRIRGLLLDPNAYGGYLAAAALVHLAVAARPGPSDRPRLALAHVGFLVAGLALADSRSAWLALVCGLGLVVLHLPSPARRRLLVPAGGAAAVAVAMFVLSSQSPLRSHSLAQRVDLVHWALQEALASPLWGSGLGSHRYLIHSTYLWLLAEAGVVALMLLAGLLLRAYWTGRRAWRLADPVRSQVGLAAIGVLGAWLGLMVGLEAFYQRHYWFVCAAAGAAALDVSTPRPRCADAP